MDSLGFSSFVPKNMQVHGLAALGHDWVCVNVSVNGALGWIGIPSSVFYWCSPESSESSAAVIRINRLLRMNQSTRGNLLYVKVLVL